MQCTLNPSKVGILATLLTVSALLSLSSVQSKFLFERLSFKHHKAAENPVPLSDSNVFVQKDTPVLQQVLTGNTSTTNTTANLTALVYNMTWLNAQISNATSTVINNTNPRLQTSIRLDKDLYQPLDVLFAEVLLINAQNKTPVAFSTVGNAIQQYYNLTLEILDTGNNLLYNTTVAAGTSTAAIYYKLNGALPTGVYTVRAYNQFVPVTTTSFAYKALNNDSAVINIQYPQTTYNLGDTVRAIVTVLLPNGNPLPSTATVSYNVSFGNATVANTSVSLSSLGTAVIQFSVPQYASTQFAGVLFTIKNGNTTYVYNSTIALANPALLVIDFFPSSGYLTNNVNNLIYYQVWTNSSRVQPLDISGASLRQKINSTTTVTLNSNVSTAAKGKGSFNWTPITTTGSMPPTVEFTLNGVSIVRPVSFTQSLFQTTNQSEVNIRIMNPSRVLGNNDDLQVQLMTNGSINASETYILQVRNGEQILFQDQYNLLPYSTKNIVVKAANFSLVSGGILSVSIFHVNRTLENFYKSKSTTTTTTTTTVTTTAAPTTTKASTGTTSAPTTTKASTGTTAAPTTTKAATTTAAPTTTKAATTTAAPTTTKAGTGTTQAPTTTKAGTTTPVPSTTKGTTTTTKPPTTTAAIPTNTAVYLTYDPPTYANASITSQFLDPKGEILFYKKPADGLKVTVTVDKSVPYLPGDTVSYTVNILNITTGKPITANSFITFSVTDVRGDTGDIQSSQNILTRQALAGNIANYGNEVIYANTLLNNILAGTATDNTYLDLVLGVQQWRIGAFDARSLLNITAILKAGQVSDQNNIQSLYKTVLQTQARPATAMVKPAPVKTGSQGVDAAINDFMTGITSARSYAHAKRANWNTTKIDMTETVAYTSAGVAVAGAFKGTFVLNDLLTNYQFNVDAFTQSGVYGSGSTVLTTRDFVSLSYVLPTFLVVGDSLKVPITIANQATSAITLNLYNLVVDPSITVSFLSTKIQLAASAALTTTMTITANSEKVGSSINVYGNASVSSTVTYIAQQSGSLNVVNKEYIYNAKNIGGLFGSNVKTTTGSNTTTISLPLPPNANSTSQNFYLKIYPTVYALLETSRKTLIAGPQTNFEQFTATLYPSINRLQLLRNSTQTPDIQVQIVQLSQSLVNAYNSLISMYELSSSNGFNIDGEDISIEAMTAYALIFFTDFSVNNTFVDPNLLKGLSTFLISRKNGKGSFMQSFSSSNSFTVPQYVHDSYIVYALAYYSSAANVTLEVTTLKATADAQIAAQKGDSYFISLLANALYKLNRGTEAQVYADALVKVQNQDGSLSSNVSATATFNGGNGTEYTLQTSALAALAWNNNLARYTSSVTNATGYLFNSILNGVVGDSGANTLFLKLAVAYFNGLQTINGNGTFVVSINNNIVASQAFTPSTNNTISFDINTYLKANPSLTVPGNTLNINLNVLNAVLPSTATKDFKALYSFTYKFQPNTSYVPPPPVNVTPDMNVTLTVGKTPIGLDAQTGKTFVYTVSLKNIMNAGSANSGPVNLAIGAPSCLALDQNYANNLVNTMQVAGWEVVDNGITVLLLKSLAPGEVRTLNVQYIQTYSGACQVRDNLAYQANGDFKLRVGTKIV